MPAKTRPRSSSRNPDLAPLHSKVGIITRIMGLTCTVISVMEERDIPRIVLYSQQEFAQCPWPLGKFWARQWRSQYHSNSQRMDTSTTSTRETLTKSEQPLITRFTRPPNQIPNMALGKLIVTYIVRNHPLCAKLLDDLRNLLGAGCV